MLVDRLIYTRNITHLIHNSLFYFFSSPPPHSLAVFPSLSPSLSSSLSSHLHPKSLSHSLSLTVVHGYQLCQGEHAVSVTSCTLGETGDPKNTFYVVGTAFVDVGEKEPTLGRVLVFSVSDSEYITCVHQYCRQDIVQFMVSLANL